MARDSKRNRVYAAELAAQNRTTAWKSRTLVECQEFVNKMCDDQWFFRYCGFTRIAIRQSRQRAAYLRPEIYLHAKTSAWTICHEVAHAIVHWRFPREPWHGYRFVRTNLDLVGHFIGRKERAILLAEYRKHRAPTRAPRKLTEEQRAAMRERFAALVASGKWKTRTKIAAKEETR